MSDYTLKPCITVIVGKTGVGKSTFGFQYLVNVDAACVFVFDWKGEFEQRLGIRHVASLAACEAALASRWVIYQPAADARFRGDEQAAFRWFMDWAFNASRRGPGKKIVVVDELWRYQNRDAVPMELATIAQMGRAEGIELLTLTQRPSRINPSILGGCTELVCFNVADSMELLKLRTMGANPDAVASLPPGEFISYNLAAGGEVGGLVF
jgi:hypothetical protein